MVLINQTKSFLISSSFSPTALCASKLITMFHKCTIFLSCNNLFASVSVLISTTFHLSKVFFFCPVLCPVEVPSQTRVHYAFLGFSSISTYCYSIISGFSDFSAVDQFQSILLSISFLYCLIACGPPSTTIMCGKFGARCGSAIIQNPPRCSC